MVRKYDDSDAEIMRNTVESAAVIAKKTTILCTINLAFSPQTFQPSHDPVLALQPIK